MPLNRHNLDFIYQVYILMRQRLSYYNTPEIPLIENRKFYLQLSLCLISYFKLVEFEPSLLRELITKPTIPTPKITTEVPTIA